VKYFTVAEIEFFKTSKTLRKDYKIIQLSEIYNVANVIVYCPFLIDSLCVSASL
jgi:hypothetical protein